MDGSEQLTPEERAALNPRHDAGGGVAEDHTGQPEPEGKAKRGPHPDAGKYVVLAAIPGDSSISVDEDGDPVEFSEISGLEFKLIWGPAEAAGQREAKNAALDANPEHKKRTEPGGTGVWLLAPPFMSGKARLAKTEQPPPIMRGL